MPQKHRLEIKRIVQEHNKTEKQVPLREPDLLIILTGGSGHTLALMESRLFHWLA